jgi:hypothetical protein
MLIVVGSLFSSLYTHFFNLFLFVYIFIFVESMKLNSVKSGTEVV